MDRLGAPEPAPRADLPVVPAPAPALDEGPRPRARPDVARAVVESTDALVIALDRHGRVELFNRACEKLLGWTEAEALGRPFWELFVLPDDVPFAQAGLRRQIFTGRSELREGVARARDGSLHRVAWHISVLHDATGVPDGLAGVGFDVTEQREVEARLRERAQADSLTGLLSRASLLEALEERPVAGVLFCDLDNFKPVNDRYGHAVGDALLVQVAQRLRGAVRDEDLVARYGGDEFVVVCPTADSVVLDRLAARIRQAVDAPFSLDGRPVRIGASVGAAVRAPGEAATAVLSAADTAMYADKRSRQLGGGAVPVR